MKARKINYNAIKKRIDELHRNIKTEASPVIVIAELLSDGSYRVLENIKNGKQKELNFKNKTEFNKYLDSLEKCTVIIDDWLEELDTNILDEALAIMTVEELRKLADDEEEGATDKEESNKIMVENINKLLKSI